MFIQLLAAPVVVALAAAGASDGVPHLNVMSSCNGAVAAGYIAPEKTRLQNCLDSEQRTREQLDKTWTTFPAADRAFCVSSIANFSPTYTELATCLEMKRALTTSKPPGEDRPTAPAPSSTRSPMPAR
jgi:hypothetical protein